MFTLLTRRIALVLAMAAVLSTLLAVAPAYADDGSHGSATAVPTAAEGPLWDNAAPWYGQRIIWTAFQGTPNITNGQTDLWVWNENVNGQNVLHIRTTTDSNSHMFTGTVTTGSVDNFYNLAVVNGGGADSANLVGYNQLTFSISTSANGDGVDVDWSGRWLSLDLFVDGNHQPGRVLYGASALSAQRMPLIVLAGRDGLLALPLSTLDGPTSFQKNIADGYYIYRDAKGYHLRLTTTKVGDVVNYKGTLFADGGQIGNVTIYKGERGDYYRLYAGQLLDLRFLTDGYVDGLDWSLNGGGLIFTLKLNGRMAAPSIALGSNPFGTVQAFSFRLTP
jgi:hypothetical protein